MMEYAVSRSKQEALKNRMRRLKVCESDIVEKFVRSGKKGGQKLNKTSTCVYLKHLPSGIEVKCQTARTQGLNRFLARRILLSKIDTLYRGRASREKERIAKIRRQKRRRSRRAKEKMLKEKKTRGVLKKQRTYRFPPEELEG